MAYVFELYFDERTEAGMRRLWSDLGALGVPVLAGRHNARPAVVFSQFVQTDVTKMRVEFKQFCMNHAPVAAQFEAYGDEGASAFLSVAKHMDLDKLHGDLHGLVRKLTQSPRPEYAPPQWKPRCLLAEGCAQAHLMKAQDLMKQVPMPIPFTFQTLALVQVNQARVNVVYEMSLGGGALRDRSSGG